MAVEPPLEQPPPPFEPTPEMIDFNEELTNALRACASTLYDRYTQYGDLGVLGWCNDFSELISAIETVGMDGALFTATRDEGLEACDQILRLELDIKKQLVLFFLSSQVARLRRFLDG